MFLTERKPEKVYDVNADIVFLVDSSTSVGEENFGKLKDFVSNVARSLNLAHARSRVAVILFSSYAQLAIGFSDHSTMLTFKEDVDKLSLVGGSRRIDRALDAAVTLLGNVPSDRPKVVIMLTAGKQDSGFSNTLANAGAPLHTMRAQTYVVAIGREPDVLELRPVYRFDSNLFVVSPFASLEPRTRPIAEHIAERTGENYISDMLLAIVYNSFALSNQFDTSYRLKGLSRKMCQFHCNGLFRLTDSFR